MRVSKSKFTPGLDNAVGVLFCAGDKVTYRDPQGGEGDVELTSELMKGGNGQLGYEVKCGILGDFFMSETRIADWEGKA